MVTPVRARGILGMALAWALGLTALATSLLVGGVLLDIVPASVYGIRELVAVAVRAFVVGGAAGAIFAMILTRQERASAFGELRRGRVAAWGFVGAAGAASALFIAAPAALPAMIVGSAILIAGALGAGSAVGVLALARRADARLHGASEGVDQSSLPPRI
jgi:hypothetical protein